MSNSLAVAAVTATLHSLLIRVREPIVDGDSALSDSEVSLRPLDVARTSEDRNQLNLFLYQAQQNAAWRNHDLVSRGAATDGAQVPLALNLFYLLTAYGRQSDELYAHRMLTTAMQLLHDNTLLTAPAIAAAAGMHELLSIQDLDQQIERIHVTPHALSLEEMSKLWAMFQAKYRTSVAYQVSVVLVDSRRPPRSVQPVESRVVTVSPTLARSGVK